MFGVVNDAGQSVALLPSMDGSLYRCVCLLRGLRTHLPFCYSHSASWYSLLVGELKSSPFFSKNLVISLIDVFNYYRRNTT